MKVLNNENIKIFTPNFISGPTDKAAVLLLVEILTYQTLVMKLG